jgi:NAD(P)H-dependent FMN reductase
MRLLAFAASLRRDSLNRKLLRIAVQLALAAGADVDVAEFSEFDMPPYNADAQAAAGFPAGAQALASRILGAQGMLIASPEYNYSLPGTLKNAIDWVSRMRPVPFRGKHGLLLSASTSMVGGIRGLWQLRIPLEGNGVLVYPDMYALAQADKAFASDGNFADAGALARLRAMMDGYLAMAGALG